MGVERLPRVSHGFADAWLFIQRLYTAHCASHAALSRGIDVPQSEGAVHGGPGHQALAPRPHDAQLFVGRPVIVAMHLITRKTSGNLILANIWKGTDVRVGNVEQKRSQVHALGAEPMPMLVYTYVCCKEGSRMKRTIYQVPQRSHHSTDGDLVPGAEVGQLLCFSDLVAACNQHHPS